MLVAREAIAKKQFYSLIKYKYSVYRRKLADNEREIQEKSSVLRKENLSEIKIDNCCHLR